VHRVLARFFRRGVEAEPAPAPLPSELSLEAAATAPDSSALKAAIAERRRERRETCPRCGRADVFAGPAGHRYCMRCALREEL